MGEGGEGHWREGQLIALPVPATRPTRREAAELALSSDRLVIGFNRYRPLSKARTVEAFAGSDPFTLDPVDELVDFSVGGVLAITPECWWAAGGMDERYVDWGCEDFAFADAAGAALGQFAVFWGLGAIIACGVPIAARKAFKRFHPTV